MPEKQFGASGEQEEYVQGGRSGGGQEVIWGMTSESDSLRNHEFVG